MVHSFEDFPALNKLGQLGMRNLTCKTCAAQFFKNNVNPGLKWMNQLNKPWSIDEWSTNHHNLILPWYPGLEW